MQAAKLADGFDSRTQVEVIGIAEKNLNSELLENVLGHAFDCRHSADRHEHRRFYFPVRRDHAPGASSACARLDLELNGHLLAIVAMAEDRSGLVHRQVQEFPLYAAIFHDESANAHWQFESSGPRAARIKIEHSVKRLLLGNVAVATDHDRESSGLWLEVQLSQIVQNVDGNAAQFEHLGFRQLA